MPIYDVDKINSPEDLPEGITAVIKRAAYYRKKGVDGLIYYDRHGRFPDGHPIVTSAIEGIDGNVYSTKNNKYIVEVIQGIQGDE